MELLSIEEFVDKTFIVPSYQRGYRWTKFNVLQLLSDIIEDMTKNCDKNKEKYNLQGLVTIKNGECFIIVDGQQRITTLFLINACINSITNEQKNFYTIEYKSRKKSKDFLQFLNNYNNKNINLEWKYIWKEFREKYQNDFNEDIKENIDFRYMFEAYKLIYEKLNKYIDEEKDIEKLRSYILKNCGFIWSQIELKDNVEEPQNIFTNLNMGKIYLTNSELIKCEFMNPVYYDKNFETKILFLGKKWNEIEKDLQNPNFWTFIPHKNQYGIFDKDNNTYIERNIFLSRIDDIFRLYLIQIYDGNLDNYKKDFEKHSMSDYFIYEKVKEWIEDSSLDIESKWGQIEKLFSNIEELYESDGRYSTYINKIKNNENYNIYNLISYLIYVYSNVQNKSELEVGKLIIDILKTNRDERKKFIKEKIKKEFFEIYNISDKKDEKNKNIEKALKQIERYKEDDIKIENLFILLNVILLDKNILSFNRFNFLDYKDLHINHIYCENENIMCEYNEKNESLFNKRKEIIDNIYEYHFNKNDIYIIKNIVEKLKNIYDSNNVNISITDILIDEVLNEYISKMKIEFESLINENLQTEEFINKIIKKFELDNSNLDIVKKIYEQYIKINNNYNYENKYINDLVNKFLEVYKSKKIQNISFLKSLYEQKLKEYFDNKEYNKYLFSNDISNLFLFKNTTNGYLDKKEMVNKLISNGEFIPYSTLLIFTDKYRDIKKYDNIETYQWLLSSRKKYFDDILNNLCSFFK